MKKKRERINYSYVQRKTKARIRRNLKKGKQKTKNRHSTTFFIVVIIIIMVNKQGICNSFCLLFSIHIKKKNPIIMIITITITIILIEGERENKFRVCVRARNVIMYIQKYIRESYNAPFLPVFYNQLFPFTYIALKHCCSMIVVFT